MASEIIGNIQTYQCSICKSIFYKEVEMFQRFANGQIEILKEFDSHNLELNEKLKIELNSIGLSDDLHMNKTAPVKVLLKNGKTIDFATIRISKKPPIGYYFDHFKEVIFIDKVEAIEKSEFGLSKKIREKAKNAEEMRMGFYPTVLGASNGEKVVINGKPLFFRNGKIKRADLKLENESWDHRVTYVYEEKIEEQVIVISKK